MNNVVKFPYTAGRRVHSKKPRASKNGTLSKERAHRLLVLRTMTGQNQEDMCDTVGCEKTAWSNYESPGQDRLIDVAIAVRLCDRYGVTLDWIYRNIAFGVPKQVLQGLDKAEKDIAANVAAAAATVSTEELVATNISPRNERRRRPKRVMRVITGDDWDKFVRIVGPDLQQAFMVDAWRLINRYWRNYL
jgi:transcriptional regulator with XRE-family HTH domain